MHHFDNFFWYFGLYLGCQISCFLIFVARNPFNSNSMPPKDNKYILTWSRLNLSHYTNILRNFTVCYCHLFPGNSIFTTKKLAQVPNKIAVDLVQRVWETWWASWVAELTMIQSCKLLTGPKLYILEPCDYFHGDFSPIIKCFKSCFF